MSKAKFWQMIGRGTRLCPGLMDGADKNKFYIFDFCGNFEFFRMNKGKETAETASLQGAIFALQFEMAFKLQDLKYQTERLIAYRRTLVEHMAAKVQELDRKSFAVRAHLKYVELYAVPSNYQALTYEDTLNVRHDLSPLIMPEKDDANALRFDALMYGIELAHLAGNSYSRAKRDLLKKASALAGIANIPEITAQAGLLEKLLHTDYLDRAGIDDQATVDIRLSYVKRSLLEIAADIRYTVTQKSIFQPLERRHTKMEALAYRLSEARKNTHLTQAQVAERLGITTQSVSAWECGTSTPDIEKLPEIALLYGVTTDWLLSGKQPSQEILDITANLSDRLFDESHMGTYISGYCDARELFQTKRALKFAREKHEGQYRKQGHSGEQVPYIYHPLLLTCHAIALGLIEDDLLSVCLLHDVCEDCDVLPEELPVSPAAIEAVRLLTKPRDFDKSEKDEKAYYSAIAGNRIASMVKLLDRCNNISSMATSFSDEHMAKYIKETQDYIIPLLQKMRGDHPEYSNPLFLIRYHMNSVIDALRHHMAAKM